MGLTFEKLEAVKFGDLVAQPKGTMELKLRLQQALKNTKDENSFADIAELLPQFFPEKQEEVKDFIGANLTIDGIATLAAYLVGGDDAVERVHKAVEDNTNG